MLSIKQKSIRHFTNSISINKHLFCIVCQETLYNPTNLTCGHTFCLICIEKWLETENICPICRKYVDKLNLSKNYIVSSIIDELEVVCNNKECPWKGTVSDLNKHLSNCQFDEKTMSNEIKSIFNSNIGDDDTFVNSYLTFNSNSSLKARLYEKDKELIRGVLENKNEMDSNCENNDFILKMSEYLKMEPLVEISNIRYYENKSPKKKKKQSRKIINKNK